MLKQRTTLKPTSATIKISPVEIRNEHEAYKLMNTLGVSLRGAQIMSLKSMHSVFKIEGIKSWEANIIKQHLLSLGSDAAIERKALVKDVKTAMLIFGNKSQLRQLCQKLGDQPFQLKKIAQMLKVYLGHVDKERFIFRARDKKIILTQPIVCGIINVTEDSFSGDGLLKEYHCEDAQSDAIVEKAEQMIKDGATMIDIGGESTRPFAKPLKAAQEIKRVIPALKSIRKRFKKIPLSVDTYKYPVARAAVEEGADIINDISALRNSPQMAKLIREHSLGCVLMHMKGTPQTMQMNPRYDNVVEEILSFFNERLQFCQRQGIASEQLCLDPGIGFGKRLEDNLALTNELYKLKIFGLPLFLGLSRKSFIGKVLKNDVNDRLIGTIAASIVSMTKGVHILRVHDVKETVQAITMASAIIYN